ncbi:hypothetical protein [Lysobacter hankyongensis]|uniref:hypothetical protein n=1 Tax=Lysobacter hankyongensis TaxID=1176535 RepID=UPI0031ED9D42
MPTTASVSPATAAAPATATPATIPATAPPPVPAQPRAETAQQPIPYRDEGGGLAADAGGAVFAAILLLALLIVGLQFARKRGLLDRWIVAAPARAAGRPQMQVEQALRVGAKTMVYRIRDGERRYLLVESTAQTTLVPVSDVQASHLPVEEIENDAAATPDDSMHDDTVPDDREPDDAR